MTCQRVSFDEAAAAVHGLSTREVFRRAQAIMAALSSKIPVVNSDGTAADNEVDDVAETEPRQEQQRHEAAPAALPTAGCPAPASAARGDDQHDVDDDDDHESSSDEL